MISKMQFFTFASTIAAVLMVTASLSTVAVAPGCSEVDGGKCKLVLEDANLKDLVLCA